MKLISIVNDVFPSLRVDSCHVPLYAWLDSGLARQSLQVVPSFHEDVGEYAGSAPVTSSPNWSSTVTFVAASTRPSKASKIETQTKANTRSDDNILSNRASKQASLFS